MPLHSEQAASDRAELLEAFLGGNYNNPLYQKGMLLLLGHHRINKGTVCIKHTTEQTFFNLIHCRNLHRVEWDERDKKFSLQFPTALKSPNQAVVMNKERNLLKKTNTCG